MTRARQLADAGRRANYLDNVASDINTQLNAKAPLASPTFTGNFTSVGIDDNADATAITIDDSERVGIGTTTPGNVGTGTNNSTGATLNVKSASGLGELTAQGATGGALNLVDTAGGTNDKWIRLIADGGYLKFLTMTDNGSGTSVEQAAMDLDLGQFQVKNAKMWAGTLSGSSDANRRVPHNNMSNGLVFIHGHGYGYAARGCWHWQLGTNQNYIYVIRKSNGWGSTVNNPTVGSNTAIQFDTTVINPSFGGSAWLCIGVG